MDRRLLVAVRGGAAVSWGNAWLRGLVSLDSAAARITGSDGPHLLAGVPNEPDPVSWPVALGRLRGSGAVRLQLALPAPGDPLGLAGPVELTERATAVGAAVLVAGSAGAYAVVPDAAVPYAAVPYAAVPDAAVPDAAVGGGAVRWSVSAARTPPAPPTPGEIARELTAALHGSTSELEQLDVARHRPGTAEVVAAAERLLAERPPAYPPRRASELLATGLRLLAVLDHALEEDGAAVSARAAAARAEVLRPLQALARRALVAAYSAPPEDRALSR